MIHLEFSPKSSSLPIEILTLNYTFFRRRESDSDESTRNLVRSQAEKGKTGAGTKVLSKAVQGDQRRVF